MATLFNITAADQYFLGEDKVIEFAVYEQDKVTPFDVSALPLEWNMRRKDNSPDPAILTKGIGTGLTVVGSFNINPNLNTQRVQVSITSDETDPLVTTLYTLKPNVAYRHSLKRKDSTNENILSYGSITFLQATER